MSHNRSSQSHIQTQHSNQNLSELHGGENVDVRYPDGRVEKAKIDAKPPGSKIIWLLSCAAQGRKMYGDWEGGCLTSPVREHGHE